MFGLGEVAGSLDRCIGLLEFRSIARGVEATDAMLKIATVDLLLSRPISPGKYVSLVRGEVEDVRFCLQRGEETGGDDVVDRLLLPNPHPDVAAVVSGTAKVEIDRAIGIVETLSVAAAIVCGDVAAKRAAVRLVRMGLGVGIGGKGFVTLCGDEDEVQTAVEAAADYAIGEGKLLRSVVIPRLHDALKPYM